MFCRALQLAEAHVALAGPLRSLAERSIEAFCSFNGISSLVVQPGRSTCGDAVLRDLAPAATLAVELSARQLGSAHAATVRLLAALQAQHADVQLRMLRRDAAQAGKPAFLALAAEAEEPWEPLFRDIAQLSHSAIASRSDRPVSAFLREAGELQTALSGAQMALLDRLLALEPARDGIMRGGELSLELLMRVRGMLHQLRLAPLDVYLGALSAALSLLVGQMAGCVDALHGHVRCAEAARDALAAAQAGS